ncbi:hypothetical protein [Streptomyces chartreusis]|uniref:Uncharacterized protein n=1 Tax=Streptomyces chartreusis TaxID=1969 RepID=A0A7H8TGA4_STRCX|nr:hypothetical protein [Streptomyces chartreusis]QKZ22068.1 hypothetical protein HUT05_34795 [Streptomyces chartreusis]
MTDENEPVIVTGPNDPPVIRVQIADPDDINDEPITVYLVAEFTDRPSIELSFDKYRAHYIGSLLIKAADMLDERIAEADDFFQIVSGGES